jgi:poly(A) polymerase/tRNA nucleotidyltransferase (CCA-adding enzyme)
MQNYSNLIYKIPKEVSYVTSVLEKAGFDAYLVGGCVRDLLIDRVPKDWDITTNAKPEDIVSLFEKTIYENKFGTVGVCIPIGGDVTYETESRVVSRETPESNVSRITSEGIEYELIEVTPYRTESQYTDFRHPDEVSFSDKLEDDLKRRDFTINAIALSVRDGKVSITDIFDGIKDIERKVLRTVGEADERFNEDALRMLRAIRLSIELNFSISNETNESIFKNSNLIKNISSERIRDEFIKIIMSENPAYGIVSLQKLGLLKYIIPELEEGIGCEQGGEHIYDVYEHLLHALKHAGDKNWSLEIRLSALFHDIGKPKTRRLSNSLHKKKYTFYGHEVVGAKMSIKIMERLKFSKKEIDLVCKLVRNHMFFSDTEQITLSAVRRIIAKVGVDNIWLLMNIRECDRVGMKKVEAPYRLRKYFAMIEEALHDPISVKQLKVDGNFLIKDIGIKPGPRMGWILNSLLEEVLENPEKNTVEYLKNKAKELDTISDSELQELGEKAKEVKEGLEEKEVEKLHEKHKVRK